MFRHLMTLALTISFGSLCAADKDSPEIEGFTEPYADIELAASEMGVVKRCQKLTDLHDVSFFRVDLREDPGAESGSCQQQCPRITRFGNC